jgi:hypothetical protein
MRQWLLNVWRMCLGLVEVPAKVRRSRERAQLRFEQLEDRAVPATFLVRDIFAGVSSSSPTGSLRSTARCFSLPTMAPTASSSGRAMARPPAPCWSRTSGRARLAPILAISPTSTARCFSSPTMAPTATNSGRAMARPPAPCWSRTSGRARLAPILAGSPTSTARCFSGQRWHERLRTLEERWHVHRHRAGQGHPAGPASSNPRYLTNVNGTLFFRANDGTTARTLEERWHVHRHRAGQGHPAGPG